MFLYVYWSKDPNMPQQWQAFSAADKAADFVFKQISKSYVTESLLYKDSIPEELAKLNVILKMTPSFDTATKLIAVYEEYILYIKGEETPIHIIKHIQTIE
jgi:hypothetical protein